MIQFFLIIISSLSFGGALTPSKDKSELYLDYTKYETNRIFNQNKESKHIQNKGEFNKNEISYFFLHGIKDRYSFALQGTLIQNLSYKDSNNKNQNLTSGDHFIGGRFNISKNLDFSHSLQLLVSFPIYSSRANPAPGNHQHDIDLRYLFDFYGLKIIDFVSVETALRKRLSSPADQIRLDLTFGRNFSKILLMGHLSGIRSLRNQTENISSTNPYANKDFDLYKAGISSAYWYEKDSALQLIFMKDIAGRNTGDGSALTLSWWRRF